MGQGPSSQLVGVVAVLSGRAPTYKDNESISVTVGIKDAVESFRCPV